MLDGLHLALQILMRLGQFDDALGRPLGGLGKGRNGGGVRRGPGAYFTVEPSIHAGCTAFSGSRKRRLERTGSIPASSSLSPVQSIWRVQTCAQFDTKRACSRRLAHTQNPVRSQYSTFI